MSPIRTSVLAAALAAGLPGGGTRPTPSAGHPPPTVHVQIEVLPNKIQSVVTGELQVWNTWFGLDISKEYMISDEDQARMLAAAKVFFEDKNPVFVDGERVLPVVESVVPPVDYSPRLGIPNVVVNLHYPYEQSGTPREVDLRWDEFAETDWFERKAVPAMIKFQGDVQQATFTPAEPQFVWHARDVRPRRAPAVAAVPAPPPLQFFLPLASIALLLVLVVVVPFVKGLRSSPKLAWGLCGATVLGAVLLRDTWRVGVEAPWSGVSVPAREEALRVFETLHGNIYRAFAAGTEEEIYDLLAVSVDPAILDELYADVYESLILRGQGGAVCEIDRVEVLSRDVAGADADDGDGGRPHFEVGWSWRVHGVVSHWGHQHKRMNQYHARYTVRHDGRSWKISKVRVLDHQRVDEDG